jgi:hypothetical protein
MFYILSLIFNSFSLLYQTENAWRIVLNFMLEYPHLRSEMDVPA